MLAEDFVHLHIHSEYSLLDGSIKIKKLVSELSKRGAKAAALTDHDAMHGVLEFYLACQAEKINGIIGYEINVEPFLLSDKKVTTHLTLLAENAEGYANLKKLCTIANTTGKDALYLDSTNVTLDEIKNHCSGLICLSGCFKGEISRLVSADKLSDANLYLQRLIKIFGKENLYIELMDNGIVEQNKLIPNLVLLAAENQLEIVATANVHYLQPDDKETHMLLLAIKHN